MMSVLFSLFLSPSLSLFFVLFFTLTTVLNCMTRKKRTLEIRNKYSFVKVITQLISQVIAFLNVFSLFSACLMCFVFLFLRKLG